MKKYILVTGGAIILLLFWSLYTPLLNKESSKNNDGFHVGVILPLTGKSASIGERVRNGLLLAQKQIERTETPIHLTIEDDGGEAPKAVNATMKLINTDHEHLIVGPVKSDAMLAVAPIVEKNKVILLSPTAGASSISSAGDYVFRNIELPDAHGDADVQFFQTKVGNGPIAVFTANASNAKSYSAAFIASANQLQVHIGPEHIYQPDETDFRTQISTVLKSEKPMGIFVGVATAKDAGLIVSQLRKHEFNGPILLSVAANAKELFDTMGANVKSVYVSVPYFDPSQNSNGAFTYNEQYKQLYGTDSDAFAANAYDALMMLHGAYTQCKKDVANTACVKDYLYHIKNYNGVGGMTTFDKNGDVVKPVMIMEAVSGKLVKYQ
jgi:branched-chain amino acid transport system substrate-binding protein